MDNDKLNHARANARGWLISIQEMLSALKAARGNDNDAYEEAQQAVREAALSALVRDAWHEPGRPAEDGPDEYELLLTTGGPALRIWGKLDTHGEPESAELQMQDWCTPWVRYPASEPLLLDFARQFYFGD